MSQPDDWRARIRIDRAFHHGDPCFAGTRIPVSVIVGSVAEGDSWEQILRSYPQLKRKDIQAALRFAAEGHQSQLNHYVGRMARMHIVTATFRNGRLELMQPVDWHDGTRAEVIPLPPAAAPPSDADGLPATWPDGYFEQTAGALSGEKFERPTQGDLPVREDW